jgi:hypothetical protein
VNLLKHKTGTIHAIDPDSPTKGNCWATPVHKTRCGLYLWHPTSRTMQPVTCRRCLMDTTWQGVPRCAVCSHAIDGPICRHCTRPETLDEVPF